jgi:hypothetical protein
MAAADPTNALGQRELMGSYYLLATLFDKAQKNQIRQKYWESCRDTLRHMRRAGMFLDPPLVDLLTQLEARFG